MQTIIKKVMRKAARAATSAIYPSLRASAIKSPVIACDASALADLEKDMHAFAQELYKNAAPNAEAQQSAPQDFGGQQAPGNGGQNPGADGEGPVFDAEFDKKD